MRALLLTFLLASTVLYGQRGGGGSRGGGGGGGFRGGAGVHTGSGFRGGGGFHGGGGFRGGGFRGGGFRGGGGFGFGHGFRGGFGFGRGFYNRGFYGAYWYPYFSLGSYGGYYGGYYDPYYYSYYPDPYYYGSNYYSAPATSYYYAPAPVEPREPVVINQYYTQPRPAAPPLVSNSSYYLIALPNGTVEVAISYWVDRDILHFVTKNRIQRNVPLSAVDRDLTDQLNRERGVQFNWGQTP